MGTMRTVGMLLGALLLVGGCAHQSAEYKPVADSPYRIGSSDVLDVAIWKDPDLSRVVPVRPDGMITLPIAGELKAEGKTAGELEQELRQKLLPFVQDPRVTVIVKEINSSRVFVTGEVAHPGVFALTGHTSLIQAIALAGGFNEFASTDSIVVIRQQDQGRKINVRYDDLLSDKPNAPQFFLQPGDTVVVP
jgi:polysaccharide export outer membrane protein